MNTEESIWHKLSKKEIESIESKFSTCMVDDMDDLLLPQNEGGNYLIDSLIKEFNGKYNEATIMQTINQYIVKLIVNNQK